MDKTYVIQKGDKLKRYFVSIDRNWTEVWSTKIEEAYIFGEPISPDLFYYNDGSYNVSLRRDGEEVVFEVKVETAVKVEIVNG